MRTWCFASFSLAALLASPLASADEFDYRIVDGGQSITTPWFNTKAQACSSWIATWESYHPSGPNQKTYDLSPNIVDGNCRPTGTETLGCIEPNYPSGCGTANQVSFLKEFQTRPAEINAECDLGDPLVAATVGQKASASNWQSISPSSSDFCDTNLGCQVKVRQVASSGSESAWTFERTGTPCSEGDEAVDIAASPDKEECLDIGDGTYCAAAAGNGQCGFLNDKYVCLQKTPDKGCQSFPGAGKVCAANADSPPAPDNGTPGVKASPDGTISQQVGGVTNNYNYYSSSTVTGSSRGGPPDGPPATGVAERPVGEEPADGDDVAAPALPEIGEADTFGESTSAFVDGLYALPLITAATSVGASLPAGSCPATDTFTIFGESFSFVSMCTLWEDVSGPLGLVMLAFYSLIGLRIVLTA